MSALIIVIIGLIIIAALVYGESFLSPPLDGNLVRLIQAATVIGGVLLIAQRTGVL